MRVRLVPPLFLVLLLLMALVAVPIPGRAQIPPWEIEKLPSTPAPPFSLPDLQGKQIASTAFQGRVLLVNFWATWCAPCRNEMAALDRLQRKYQEQGLTVIGISIDQDLGPVKQFLETVKVGFPILHDPGMTSHDAYKVYSYPTTFLVDRKGIIRQYWIGIQEWEGEEVGKILQGTLR